MSDLLQGCVAERSIQDFTARMIEKEGKDVPSEEDIIMDISIWMEEHGLDPGEMYYDLSDENGAQLATIDIAWPDGIQTGLSEPVAVLIEEPIEIHQIVNTAGYRYFTEVDTFKKYVESYID